MEEPDASALPSWAARYVGLPYRTGGKDASGIDCWGLFNLVWAEQFGRPLPPYDGALWHPGASAAEVGASARAYAERFVTIQPGEERQGDGILMRMRGQAVHLAMVVIPGWMLHVEETTDSCVERYRTFEWERRIVSFHRFI